MLFFYLFFGQNIPFDYMNNSISRQDAHKTKFMVNYHLIIDKILIDNIIFSRYNLLSLFS